MEEIFLFPEMPVVAGLSDLPKTSVHFSSQKSFHFSAESPPHLVPLGLVGITLTVTYQGY